MKSIFKEQLKTFDKLSLTELNAKASYLKRIDRKFLLTNSQFKEVLKDLKQDFQVLEIAENRVFSYDNIYMDTDDYLFYNQHQNRVNPRTKIRTRLYEDSNLAFFEYKHKIDWVTRKFRYDFPIEEHGKMTKWKKRFFEWVWQSINEWAKAPTISQAIKTKYKRITLVSRNWTERLTIDFDIKTIDLRDKNKKEIELKGLVIIESKSMSKKCFSCEIMKKHWLKQAKACSKYSLWVVYSWLAKKFDHFKETMEKIKEIRMETLKNRTRTTSLKSGFTRTKISAKSTVLKK